MLALSLAVAAAVFTPAHGHYAGDQGVSFGFDGQHITNWHIDGQLAVHNAKVTKKSFYGRYYHHEISGNWHTATRVCGVYKYYVDYPGEGGVAQAERHWCATKR